MAIWIWMQLSSKETVTRNDKVKTRKQNNCLVWMGSSGNCLLQAIFHSLKVFGVFLYTRVLWKKPLAECGKFVVTRLTNFKNGKGL